MIRPFVIFVCAVSLCTAAEVRTVIIFGVDGLGANVLRAKKPPHFSEFQRSRVLTRFKLGV
jgi:hypothetical protein